MDSVCLTLTDPLDSDKTGIRSDVETDRRSIELMHRHLFPRTGRDAAMIDIFPFL